MNGIYDMGGMQDFGPVLIEANEHVFHHDWEGQVQGTSVAVMFATQGALMSRARAVMEEIPPAQYLEMSYYEHWLYMLEHRIVEMGLITKEELAAGHLITSKKAQGQPVTQAQVWPFFQHGASTAMQTDVIPRFESGDRVRVLNLNPSHHTRLPRYTRGRLATVVARHGAFALPDALAVGAGMKPEQLYTVRLEAEELWGPDGEPRSPVYLGMYESYLEAAPA